MQGGGKGKKQLLKKGGGAGKANNAVTGLKISFSTADLAKTTDKIVAAQVLPSNVVQGARVLIMPSVQVKGALSKQGNIGAVVAKKSNAPSQVRISVHFVFKR